MIGDLTDGILRTGPASRGIFERVYRARHEVYMNMGVRPDEVYRIHIAENLWIQMLAELGVDPSEVSGRMMGMHCEIDRTLNDGQIRLRHEVIA